MCAAKGLLKEKKFQKSNQKSPKNWIELAPPNHPHPNFFWETHHCHGQNTHIVIPELLEGCGCELLEGSGRELLEGGLRL